MSELNLIIHFLLSTFVAGLIGTGGMTLFMYLLTKVGFTNADMVRAIGSLITKSLDHALMIGSVCHIASGVFFAVVYTLGFNFFGIQGTGLLMLAGTAYGFAHGFVLSFILVSSVAQHHPIAEFREAGISVAIAHLLGHVIYGALVGMVIGLSGFSVVA